jgi:pimeloyl-ACP methyl ester carboxylesterase
MRIAHPVEMTHETPRRVDEGAEPRHGAQHAAVLQIAERASPMATYVLVHGAWHGSWCWKRVRKALQAASHDVFTPTLTGVGERSHLNAPGVNLSTHIADVANLIRLEELSDVILCGHSYGGCVMSGAADRVPNRIRALVYLDAFILENGEALIDLLPPEQVERMRRMAQDAGDGWKVPPIPAEAFKVNPRDSAWVDRQCTPQSLAAFEERIKLTNSFTLIKDVTHILATGYTEGSPFPACHERAKKKGWKTRTIPCGHDVMLDLPEELTALLLDFAG